MNTDGKRIEAAAKLLCAKDFGSKNLSYLNVIVAEQKILDLVREMLNFEKLKNPAPEDAIYHIMDVLQALVEVDKLSACLLMSQLYDFASALYMHDVCNSIDIWIFKNHTPELKKHLLLNAAQLDEGMKKHYEEWVCG